MNLYYANIGRRVIQKTSMKKENKYDIKLSNTWEECKYFKLIDNTMIKTHSLSK